MTRSRPQSEVIGVLILTGVIILLLALVGLFAFSTFDTGDEPTVRLDATVDSNAVTIVHDGGDGMKTTDIEVVLGGDVDTRVGLETLNERQGDGDARFEPSEIRRRTHGATDTLTVEVVHEPSNTVLFQDALDVPE